MGDCLSILLYFSNHPKTETQWDLHESLLSSSQCFVCFPILHMVRLILFLLLTNRHFFFIPKNSTNLFIQNNYLLPVTASYNVNLLLLVCFESLFTFLYETTHDVNDLFAHLNQALHDVKMEIWKISSSLVNFPRDQ